MSRTHTNRLTKASTLVPLALLAAVASFGIGMHTAGDVSTVPSSSATEGLAGDVTGDGLVDVQDAIRILELSQGYGEPTIGELRADPNGNGSLTVDDALRILRSLPR